MSSQAGIYYFDGRPVPEEICRQLYGALGEHDTDARGEFRAPGLYMAHANGWFDELSKAERQPFVSARGNIITFDGRLDNRTELLAGLREHTGTDTTDSALALAAFENKSERGLHDLVGDWSLAVYEPVQRSIVLASDYSGMRPFFYHANAERVVWSSYLKSLVAFLGRPELEERFIAGFIARARPPGYTPYRDVFSVPSGRAMRFSSNGITTTAFWELPVHTEIHYADEREYDERLVSLFQESLRARLRTSYPAFMELSGGWDSSSIVCLASDLLKRGEAQAPSYVTMSYALPGTSDSEIADAVRTVTGADGIFVDIKQFLNFDPSYLDDAIPNSGGAMYRELARVAGAQGARTYFAGHSGDVLLGNIPEDCEQIAAALRRGHIRPALREAVAWSTASRMPLWTVLRRGTLACLPQSWRSAKSYHFEGRGFSINEQQGEWLLPAFKKRTGLDHPDAFVLRDWHHAVPEKRRNLRLISRQLETREFYGPQERQQHLYYVDPYLHRPLLEFLITIPADQLCRPDEKRRLMRRAFQNYVPQKLFERRGKGDVMGPISLALRKAVTAILADPQPIRLVERGYIDGTIVNEQLTLCKNEQPYQMNRLAQVVALEQWLRHNEGTLFS